MRLRSHGVLFLMAKRLSLQLLWGLPLQPSPNQQADDLNGATSLLLFGLCYLSKVGADLACGWLVPFRLVDLHLVGGIVECVPRKLAMSFEDCQDVNVPA